MISIQIVGFVIICFCQQKDGIDEWEEGAIWCKNATGRSYQFSQAAWAFKEPPPPSYHDDDIGEDSDKNSEGKGHLLASISSCVIRSADGDDFANRPNGS